MLVTQHKMNKENFEKIKKKLLKRIPIITKNNPKVTYDIEERINYLIKNTKGNDVEKIYKEINKLRKYNYDAYV